MGKRPNKFKTSDGGAGGEAAPAGADLKTEVAEFAASLGLVAGGGSASDAAFDDFAPTKANRRLGRAEDEDDDDIPTKSGKKSRKEKDGASKGKNKGSREREGPGIDDSEEEPTADKPKGRQWNFGAGPRPASVTNALASGIGALDEEGCWYEAAEGLPPLPESGGHDEEEEEELDEEEEEELRSQAEALEASAAEAFSKRLAKRNSAEAKWLQLSRTSGTTSDRVAALTLLVQENAVANLSALDGLLKYVTKSAGGKDVVAKAIEALRELFVRALLPDRPLKLLVDQPLHLLPSNTKAGARQLLYWHVEDSVKRRYAVFVDALDERSRDNLEFVKEKAVKAAYELLAAKPEQEAKLLALVVNKLGDPSRKLASKAGYLLLCLLDQHPGMKAVVVREVERLAFRPNLGDRARYYAVVFLNQVVLSHKAEQGGAELAKQLIDIYFTIFRLVLSGKAGAQAEAAAREAEKAKAQEASGKGKGSGRSSSRGGRGGRGVRGGRGGRRGGRGSKAPDPGKKGSGAVLARYLELDARLLSGLLAGVRRAFPFVDSDEVESLVEKHSPDLFRIVHSASLNTAAQALLLLHQLMVSRNAVSDRFYRALYAVLLNPDLPRATKAPMLMSLVLKAMKNDVSVKRTAAFCKRLLQVAIEQPANFACGVLMILSEVLKARPGLWQAIMQPEERDDLENFVDAKDEDDDSAIDAKEHGEDKPVAVKIDIGSDNSEEEEENEARDHEDGDEEDEDDIESEAKVQNENLKMVESAMGKKLRQSSGYDMRKREPLYAGAEQSAWWELAALAGHMHPSVAAMARTLLSGAPVVYDGNPLQDMALTPFLDKFIQKKAKSHLRGTSLMQPISISAGKETAGAVTSAAFAKMAKGDVTPAEEFFHKYFSIAKQRIAQGKTKKKAKKGEDEEDSEASSDSDQEMDFLEQEEERGAMGVGKIGDDGMYSYESLGAAMAASGGESGDGDNEGEEVDEEEFDGNVMDLPSPSSSENAENFDDDFGIDGGDASEDDDSNDDDAALAQMAFNEDQSDSEADFDDSMDMSMEMDESDDDDDEPEDLVTDDTEDERKEKGGSQDKQKIKSKSMFASADDYAAKIDAAMSSASHGMKDKRNVARTGSKPANQDGRTRPAMKRKVQNDAERASKGKKSKKLQKRRR